MVNIGVSVQQLVSAHPFLYHMAEDGSWPSIREKGLLSTSALLDLFEIPGERRVQIEARHRPESVVIENPKYGKVVIRDQKPMRESALTKCLEGCSAVQWYRFLNKRVFFWPTEQRVTTLLSARAYRGKAHTVLTIDTEALLSEYEDKIMLSPINSGSTIYRPMPRSIHTFQPMKSYPYRDRVDLRGRLNAIAELSISYAVPNIAKFALRVERRRGTELLQRLL